MMPHENDIQLMHEGTGTTTTNLSTITLGLSQNGDYSWAKRATAQQHCPQKSPLNPQSWWQLWLQGGSRCSGGSCRRQHCHRCMPPMTLHTTTDASVVRPTALFSWSSGVSWVVALFRLLHPVWRQP